ncbi:MAG TPA: chromate transporter [Verrucomicrobia bacterium]|nr:chromate transporter [Verrucomicrobiota bacterium]
MVRPPYPSLFWSFLRIGAGAFGGGMAALPVFEAELVHRRHWLTPVETTETYAISQSVPGVIIVNFAVLSGLRLSGKRGALVAAVAVALPSFFIILALAALFTGHWENRWVAAALSGLRPAVVAIVAGAALRLGRNGFRSPLFLLAAGASAGLMLSKILGPIPLILLGAAAGLAIHFLRRKMEAAP